VRCSEDFKLTDFTGGLTISEEKAAEKYIKAHMEFDKADLKAEAARDRKT